MEITVSFQNKIGYCFLYANDHALLAEREDELQGEIHILSTVYQGHCFKISNKKTKVMTFLGNFQVITKIVVNNNIVERLITLIT